MDQSTELISLLTLTSQTQGPQENQLKTKVSLSRTITTTRVGSLGSQTKGFVTFLCCFLPCFCLIMTNCLMLFVLLLKIQVKLTLSSS